MPTYQLLTDRSLAQSSAITPTTLIHIVYTGDPSQNIAGSSYKAELGQLVGLFSGASDTFVTGGTYSAGTITFINSSGSTFSVSGLTEPFTGGTVSGATNFTNGLTANTISATTYQNLPLDIRVTGGTYSAGTATFTNNSGGTFNVTGFTTGDTTTITGATSVGTGVTIFDSVIDRDIKINSITGDTLEKITTTLSSNTIEVGINEQNLDLWSLVVQGNRLISGGASYVSGLTFETSALEYIIGGTIYDIPLPTTLVLNSGDSVFNRIDVIVADVSGNTSVVEGTPSANPEKPDIDEETQVEVTFVSIPANGTTPDIDLLLLYNENVGPPTEWSFGAVGLQPTRISGSSTDQTYSGLTSIRVSGVTGTFTTSFRLTGSTTVDTNQFATLQFAIRNLSANTTSSQIRLGFRTTGNTQNGNYVYMNAAGSSGYVQYSSTNTSSWQLISIPLWQFYLTNTNVQVLDVSFNSPNARYYFDMIQLVEGFASSPPTNAWTTIKGDGSTTIIAPNPNATLTISGGTNIGSFISGTSTVVLNLDNNINLNGVTANTISATTYLNLPLSNFTGGTVSGATNFTNGLTANTISATTYLNLPQFSGGSGNCITDLYTTNIHSCSPLNINPLDEGNVYFGSTSGITLDILNKRIGINTSTPQYVFDARGVQSRLYYDSESIGGRLLLSGNTNAPRISVAITPYLTKPIAGFELGMRAWNDVSYPGYGKVGDAFFYAGNETYGFNFLNPPGTGTEDYIRFYAGQTANGTTPDIHIQGSGATRGYVGIGTDSPNYPLQILGGTDTFYYDPFSSAGGVIAISGDSNAPRVSVQTYNSPISNIILGIRSITDTANTLYGKTGDTFLYASQSVNGINIANSNGTGTEDYIRFYAGKSAISTNTPDIHIQGSGSTKGYIGINNSNPQYRLDILDTDNRLYYDPSSAGGTLSLSGNTKLPRYDFIASPYLTKPLVGGSIGVRAWDDVTYGGYGNVGDIHIYANNSTNGLNIINQGPGTDTEDYIRFYAGRDALFDPDIHIQGSGSTRGYVGIGTTTPNYRLDVNGDTNISGNLNVTGTTTQSGGVIRKTKNTSLGLIVSNYNVLDTDNIIYVALTGVGGTRTVTLPTITTTNDGRVISIVYVSTASGGVNLSLVASGTDTINGSASKTGNAVYDTITVIANNSTGTWYILNEYPAGSWI